MGTKVWLSSIGRPVDPQDATVNVFDRGFLYGDSVYETLRTVGRGKIIFELDRHIERLHKSAEGIALNWGFSDQTMIEAIESTLRAANHIESRIRVIVTRGTGPLSLDIRLSQSPLLVVIVQELPEIDPVVYEKGIAAAIVTGRKRISSHRGLKTGNYLANIMALSEAIEQDAEDAIMCNPQGHVAEGVTSNVFMIRSSQIYTPSLDIGLLAGITRRVVLELANGLGMPVIETVIRPEEMREADEIFLTSTVRGIMPVTMLDGESVGPGKPGPVTIKMIEAYRQYLLQKSSEV